MTRTIFRIPHRERYTVIDNRILENASLSWAARGVLAYLLSRPDDWRVMVKELERRSELSRDGVYTLLRELRSAGYVHFKRQRTPGGTISKGVYFITEELHSLHPALPKEDRPKPGRPDTVEPHT